MKLIAKCFLALVLVFHLFIPAGFADQEFDEFEETSSEALHEMVKARVLSITDMEIPEEHSFFINTSQMITVELLDKNYKGITLEVVHQTSANQANAFKFSVGDKVLVLLELDEQGEIKESYISDFARDTYLFILVILFIVVLLIIGKLKGLKAVLTLGLTIFAIGKILVPALLKGYDPVWLTVMVTIAISAITLFVVAGFNNKSLAALLGTIGGVVLAGICATVFISLTNLTGLSDEEAQMLQFLPQGIEFNFQGLLFAGMIIGALGAIMDVGISIASSVAEVHKANPELSRWELTKAGLNVGKDIIGTMSNTLILAYAGGALPLLLLIIAYEQSFMSMINMEIIAIEIVRALSGSIGLTLAVPLTAFISASLIKHKSSRSKKRQTPNVQLHS